MPFDSFPIEPARIEKPNGTVVGPYQAVFAGDTIFVKDADADIEEGDVVLRRLPSGRDERSRITQARFFQRIDELPAHFQLKFRTGGMGEPKTPGNTFHISGGQVQIGDNNTQNILNALHDLKGKIDSAAAAPEQKQEAKALLSNFLAHPVVSSVLGGLAGSVIN